MNNLRSRIKTLEKSVIPLKKKRIIFVWGEKGREELEGLSEEDDVIIFQWEGGNDIGLEGPIDETKSLSPELDDVYGSISSPQRTREFLEQPKISIEGLDKEIEETVKELQKEGLSLKQIEEFVKEEEPGNDLFTLMSGRQKRRWDID